MYSLVRAAAERYPDRVLYKMVFSSRTPLDFFLFIRCYLTSTVGHFHSFALGLYP